MREILFKAKRKDNGEWVEGHLIQSPYMGKVRSWISTPEDKTRLRAIATYYGDWRAVEVSTDTICQYTGLTDKNGNKIWENDILFAKEPYIPTCPFSIRYNQETLSYVGLYDGFGKSFELSKELLSCSEVYGNIFDNPELLKGE